MMWLEMSDFNDGNFRLKGHEKRHFPFQGIPGCTAIPDSIVVQTSSGDFVLLVEDKAGFWQSNQGFLAQIFGGALCGLYHNFTNPDPNSKRTGRLYAIRMYNHFPSFYVLEGTAKQVNAVCQKPRLPKDFQRMTLTSDTQDPGCIKENALTKRSKQQYLGWDLLNKSTRFEAQWRLAALRNIL